MENPRPSDTVSNDTDHSGQHTSAATKGKRPCGVSSQVVFNRTGDWVMVVPLYCEMWRPGPYTCPSCLKRRYTELGDELKRELNRQQLWYCSVAQHLRRRQTALLSERNAVYHCYPVLGGRLYYISSVKDALLDPDATFDLDESGWFLQLDEFLGEQLREMAAQQPELFAEENEPLGKFIRFLALTPESYRIRSSLSWGWKDAQEICPRCNHTPILYGWKERQYECRECGHRWSKESEETTTVKVNLSPNSVGSLLKQAGAKKKPFRDKDTGLYQMKSEDQNTAKAELAGYSMPEDITEPSP